MPSQRKKFEAFWLENRLFEMSTPKSPLLTSITSLLSRKDRFSKKRLREIAIFENEMTFRTPPPTKAMLFLKSESSMIIVVYPNENIAPPSEAKPLKNYELFIVTFDSATICRKPPLRPSMYLLPAPVVWYRYLSALFWKMTFSNRTSFPPLI